jgi:hypothetical protein
MTDHNYTLNLSPERAIAPFMNGPLLVCLVLLVFNTSCLFAGNSRNSSNKRHFAYPGNYFAVGFSDRLSKPSDQNFRIHYNNWGSFVTDTFRYNDELKSSSNLVNIVLTGAVSNHYAGLKFDLGIVPFANRNSHQSLSGFLLLPVGKKLVISPTFGYTRFRKQKKIGTLTGKDGHITFLDKEYGEVAIRVQEAMHSYHYGIGLYVQLDKDLMLFFDCRYNRIFRNTPRIKVSAYSQDDGDTFFENLISADQYRRFSDGDKEVLFRDASNKPVHGLYKIGHLAFSAQLVIRIAKGDVGFAAN